MRLPPNFVVIDCETSGLSADRHALLSIGAITTGGSTFYRECLFDERKEIDQEALAVNGLVRGLENSGEVFPEYAVLELCQWLGDQAEAARLPRETRWIFGGKNPQFDWGFLEAVVREHPPIQEFLRATLSRRAIDLHTLAYWWALDNGIDLAAPGFETQRIYTALGFAEETRPHNALNGARLEMAVFRELALRQQVPDGHIDRFEAAGL